MIPGPKLFGYLNQPQPLPHRLRPPRQLLHLLYHQHHYQHHHEINVTFFSSIHLFLWSLLAYFPEVVTINTLNFCIPLFDVQKHH